MLSTLRSYLGYARHEDDEDEGLTELGGSPRELSGWSVRQYGAKKAGAFVDKQLDAYMPMVGDYLLTYLADPQAGPSAVVDGWRTTWPDLEADIKWKIRLKLGLADRERELQHGLRLRHWAGAAPPLWEKGRPQPYTWARARLLYACFPADAHPDGRVMGAMMLVNASVAFQLANWAMLLRFALIDKSDEHQLTSFILANKAYHFLIYGVVQLAQNAFEYFNCVLLDVDTLHPCSEHAPGRELGYWRDFAMEVARLATVWLAFLLLRASRGGKEQAVALEARRLGIPHASKRMAAIRQLYVAETDPPRERGGVLSALFGYDVLAFVGCMAFGLLNLWVKMRQVQCPRLAGHGPSELGTTVDCASFLKGDANVPFDGEPYSLWRDWRLWMTFDFSETSYSLLLFPFALLQIRPVRKYLTLTKPTGYDRAGRLCLALSAHEIGERDSLLAMHDEEERAASRIQARVRGHRLRAEAEG